MKQHAKHTLAASSDTGSLTKHPTKQIRGSALDSASAWLTDVKSPEITQKRLCYI